MNNYKNGDIDMNLLCRSILNYNNILYEIEEEPHVCISFMLQFLEEIYEVSNDFFNSILYKSVDFDAIINLCKKWKYKIIEIINDMHVIPEEYICIMNKKINNNLFKYID